MSTLILDESIVNKILGLPANYKGYLTVNMQPRDDPDLGTKVYTASGVQLIGAEQDIFFKISRREEIFLRNAKMDSQNRVMPFYTSMNANSIVRMHEVTQLDPYFFDFLLRDGIKLRYYQKEDISGLPYWTNNPPIVISRPISQPSSKP